MPNELYCNVILIIDNNIQTNHLHVGNAVSNPIGGAAEEDALHMFKEACKNLDYKRDISNEDYDYPEIESMIEDGCLYTYDHRIQVFINWPVHL